MLTDLPEGAQVFIFGSFLEVDNPSDIDILIVYDEDICRPKEAYVKFQPLALRLQSMFGYKVDLTLLTVNEEKSLGFLDKVTYRKLEELIDCKSERAT